MDKKKVSALVLIVTSPVLFGMTMLRAAADTAATAQAPIATSTLAGAGVPVRLSLPAIGIDAQVQRAGVTSSGDLGVPTNFTDVAWYAYGPKPGAIGSAVMDGHVDNGLALSGVFKHLDQAKKGDSIYVQDDAGRNLHFIVQDVEHYPYTAVPKYLLFGRTDAARLNLITCTGTWLPQGDTYDTRLVVYAVLASPT